jgi:hypothetical protein
MLFSNLKRTALLHRRLREPASLPFDDRLGASVTESCQDGASGRGTIRTFSLRLNTTTPVPDSFTNAAPCGEDRSMSSPVADTRVERYYYIFDSRQQRAVVVDRTTGAEYDWEGEARVQLIRHVAAVAGSATLVRFAAWCSAQTGAGSRRAGREGAADRLAEAARERADGGAAVSDRLAAVRDETNDDVLMASTVGLPRQEPEAARLLTAQAALIDDPAEAAINAAHMSERWAEFSAEESPESAARTMRERQIDWLLDRLLDAGT